MSPLLYLGLIFIVALAFGRLALRLRLPTVTGYVVGGVLLGGSFLRLFPAPVCNWRDACFLSTAVLDGFDTLGDIALAIVAFVIGSELQWRNIRHLGRSILTVTVLESLVTFVVVTAAVWLVPPHRAAHALILGAVASATAPAATVAVIQQYRARGPLTTTILAVVGMDDAVALIIYAFSSTVARSMLRHDTASLVSSVARPVGEVLLSIGIGTVLGLLCGWLVRRIHRSENMLFLIAASLCLTSGIAARLHVSQLLSVMALGAAVLNLAPEVKHRVSTALSPFIVVFFALFFILGGAHLDVTALPAIGVLGLVYFASRAAGKVGGATLGAWLGKAPPVVRRWVGLSLIPQVGVAIALALVVHRQFGTGQFGQEGKALAGMVINILLFTTIITEIVGPLLTRYSLVRSGEAQLVE